MIGGLTCREAILLRELYFTHEMGLTVRLTVRFTVMSTSGGCMFVRGTSSGIWDVEANDLSLAMSRHFVVQDVVEFVACGERKGEV